MNNEISQHLEAALNEVRSIYTKAANQIETIKPGNTYPATKLAESIGAEIGKSTAQIYPVLQILFQKYPGIEMRAGRYGGIYKQLPIVIDEVALKKSMEAILIINKGGEQ